MTSIYIMKKWDFLLLTYLIIVTVYVIFIPVSNNFILYPMLLSLALLAGISIYKNRIKIPRELVLPAVIWLSFVAYAVVIAVVEDAAYWPRTLVFLLFWPAVFSLITLGFKNISSTHHVGWSDYYSPNQSDFNLRFSIKYSSFRTSGIAKINY